jgi:hypothetical protein
VQDYAKTGLHTKRFTMQDTWVIEWSLFIQGMLETRS